MIVPPSGRNPGVVLSGPSNTLSVICSLYDRTMECPATFNSWTRLYYHEYTVVPKHPGRSSWQGVEAGGASGSSALVLEASGLGNTLPATLHPKTLGPRT